MCLWRQKRERLYIWNYYVSKGEAAAQLFITTQLWKSIKRSRIHSAKLLRMKTKLDLNARGREYLLSARATVVLQGCRRKAGLRSQLLLYLACFTAVWKLYLCSHRLRSHKCTNSLFHVVIDDFTTWACTCEGERHFPYNIPDNSEDT